MTAEKISDDLTKSIAKFAIFEYNNTVLSARIYPSAKTTNPITLTPRSTKAKDKP